MTFLVPLFRGHFQVDKLCDNKPSNSRRDPAFKYFRRCKGSLNIIANRPHPHPLLHCHIACVHRLTFMMLFAFLFFASGKSCNTLNFYLLCFKASSRIRMRKRCTKVAIATPLLLSKRKTNCHCENIHMQVERAGFYALRLVHLRSMRCHTCRPSLVSIAISQHQEITEPYTERFYCH